MKGCLSEDLWPHIGTCVLCRGLVAGGNSGCCPTSGPFCENTGSPEANPEPEVQTDDLVHVCSYRLLCVANRPGLASTKMLPPPDAVVGFGHTDAAIFPMVLFLR